MKEDAAGEGRPRPLWRSLSLPLVVLLVDTFTMAVGFYMLVPLLAYHLLDNLGLTVAVVGVLAALRSGTQHGLMPWSGSMADRLGHRRAIAGGVVIRALGFALFAFVESVPGLVVACVLAGAGGSLFHPASYAAYALLAGDRDRVSVYALRETLSNLGFVLGPLLGGLLASVDFAAVSLASAGMFAAAFVITILGLPATMSESVVDRPGRLLPVLRNRRFVRFCLVAAGSWVLFSQLYLAVPVQARDVLPDSLGLGAVYSVAALVMVLLMVPLTRTVDRRLDPRQALALGTLGLGGGLLIMGMLPSFIGLAVGVTVFTVGQILFQPMMNATVSRYAEDGAVAAYFGVHGLALAFGGVIGSVGGGLMYGLLDSPVAVVSHIPWLVWAAVAILMAAAHLRLSRAN